MTSVETAAQILDKRTPGWAEKIDLDLLDLRSAQFCVLGQVYGNYFSDETTFIFCEMSASRSSVNVFCDNGCRPEWEREVRARTEQVFVPSEWEKETVPA